MKKSKKCGTCERRRLVEHFAGNAKTKDKLAKHCRECMADKIQEGKGKKTKSRSNGLRKKVDRANKILASSNAVYRSNLSPTINQLIREMRGTSGDFRKLVIDLEAGVIELHGVQRQAIGEE